jgi:D-serine deaminase-like pyridoxal phosphate-dependent protein
MSENSWYKLKDSSEVNSPSLLVYPERIEDNIRSMIRISGSVSNLRPHIKTHKMAEIVQMQQRHGIQKFKCATIAETELLGQCHAEDVLLAMQPVGANINRFCALTDAFPNSRFSTLVDNETTLLQIAQIAAEKNKTISLYLDINSGMNRTGCIPDEAAVSLYTAMENNSNIQALGLHVYDGHIRNSNLKERTEVCDTAFQKVLDLKTKIKKKGITVPDIIAGGSPSFPVHAKRAGVDVSPGTTLLWDARYEELFPDMPIQIAAILFIRIISKPAPNIICFDLGHKSVACEMEFPRIRIIGLEDSKQIGQSEEHLVVQTQRAAEFEVGDEFYAVPYHICPTVAKYEEVMTISDGKVVGAWNVAARNQKISI